MVGFPLGETVTVVRRGAKTGVDTYGNDTYGPDSETDIPGCAVAPTSTTEDVQARDQVSAGLTVWPPAGTDIRPTDRVRVRGELYDVEGEPSSWQSPFTGSTSPMQVTLTRVAG